MKNNIFQNVNSLAKKGVLNDPPFKNKEMQPYYGKTAAIFAIHRVLYRSKFLNKVIRYTLAHSFA